MWWSDIRYLLACVSLVHVQPDLLFWSDASDQGWGANLLDHFVSGRWSLEEQNLSYQLQGVEGHSVGPSTFRSCSDGSHSRGLFRQHYHTGLYPEAGRHAVTCSEQGGSTFVALGGFSGDHHRSPVYHGFSERGSGLLKSSGPGELTLA